jgi:outer membrane protein OmpA-like peptidoglycan-associated protein
MKMTKRILLVCFVLQSFISIAQEQTQESLVRVAGKVQSKNDSSALNDVTITYEKLPYYDDMGMAKSTVDGSYEMFLLNGNSYNVLINNVNGHEAFALEIKVEATENNEYPLNLFVSPTEKEELITLDNLEFNRGSAEISSSSYNSLDEFVSYVNARPNLQIGLEGHTDFAGNAEANMRLSQARVDAVAEYIISKGVKKSRVTTKAFGGTAPLSSERTDEAKAKNRRVEVRLTRPK